MPLRGELHLELDLGPLWQNPSWPVATALTAACTLALVAYLLVKRWTPPGEPAAATGGADKGGSAKDVATG